MNTADLQKLWLQHYEVVPHQLNKIQEINSVATAFNTNIDAVLKISGSRLAELIALTELKYAEFTSAATSLTSARDVVRGIAKCFVNGIAEEWITDDKSVYEWMRLNLGYDRLQMGGQGGIIANALAVLGVKNVYVHTNSHPQLQAEQFLDLDNLLAFDENGKPSPARRVNRPTDTPLIHWIIEFSAEDSFNAWGQTFTCPKANRFIATYDPANLNLVINQRFTKYLDYNSFEYLILSGYHNLTSKRHGIELVEGTVPLIKRWKAHNPQGIIHLELASTQDLSVRQTVIEKIAPLVDSLGMNEREALDALEIVNPQLYNEISSKELTAPLLFEIIRTIKQKVGTPRLQLHMFGLYITLLDQDFRLSPQQNLAGMMLAATIAATKAGTGKIENRDRLLLAHGTAVSEIGLNELNDLAAHLCTPQLPETGIADCKGLKVIAVPTILVNNPLTLVGMGDTISSVSLMGAR